MVTFSISLFTLNHETFADDETAEPDLRAQLIVNLLRYVDWRSKDNTAPKTIHLCTLGNPISGQGLLQFDGSDIGDRKLSVVSTDPVQTATIEINPSVENTSACDVTVLGPTAEQAPFINTLTICDDCANENDTYAIRLIRVKSIAENATSFRTGFEVDLNHADASGVSLGVEILEHAAHIKSNQ